MKKAPRKPPAILVRPRIYIGEAISVGPGKIDLLRRIRETTSIAAAARSLGIPYKRAWLLIESLNKGFGRPLVETVSGGRGGGGARLTPLGHRLVESYTVLERRLNAEATAELKALHSLTT